MESGTDAITQNLTEAQEEAKKLKSYMLGFDELNVINPNSGSDETSSGQFDFELPTYDILDGLVESKVTEMAEKMKEWLGITEDIKSVSDLLMTNFGTILTFVVSTGVAILAWKIADIVTDAAKLGKVMTKLKKIVGLLGTTLKVMGIAGVITAATVGAVWLFNHTEDTMTKIGAVISAASLGVGAILAFTGVNVPLGIALMAVGAVSMASAIAMNTTGLSDEIKGIIGVITGIVSVALLAVGAVLAFTGVNIPLGIALMAGGALTMATAVIPNWDVIKTSLEGIVGGITALLTGAAFVVGAVLAFSGANLPVGIALMAAGAVGLATVAALNWDTIKTALEGPIGGITTLVGGAFLALGAILAFAGVNVPLGIALMVAGAAGIATAIAVNWNSIVDALQGPIGGITILVGTAFLALGALLAFSGANIPLGIGLMLAGAAGVATAIAVNWNSIVDALQGPLGLVTGILGGAILALGAILAFSGANIPLGIGLMLGGALMLGTAIASINWDTLKTAMEGPVGDITAVVGTAFLALGGLLAFSGANIPLGLGLMLAGAIGLGTAITANWNVIVDALQGPVGLITGILGGALLALGFILLVTGAGIPLGLGLMLAGAGGLASAIAPNWNFLGDKVKEMWDGIVSFWDSNIAPIFTAEWWLELGKKCMNGLIEGFESGVNAVIDAINSILGFELDIPEWLGGGTLSLGIQIPSVSLPRFAEGGFPEQGQMFIAREAGAEMVGNIGRRTAVANNDQIVGGIASGVASANEEQNELLREQNSLLRAILDKDSGVYLDGKNLTNSVEKYQRERGRVLITGGVI
jgi:hypothetical protein